MQRHIHAHLGQPGADADHGPQGGIDAEHDGAVKPQIEREARRLDQRSGTPEKGEAGTARKLPAIALFFGRDRL